MKTLADLKKIREKAQEEMKLRGGSVRVKIVVGMGTSGIAMGAREVMKTFLEEISNRNLTDVLVTQTGEKGLSSIEPVVDLIEEGKDKEGKGVDPRKLLAPGYEAIKQTVREKIKLFGSDNKA